MKRFLGVACALLILFVNAPMAFAASSSPADAVDTENFDDALEYIRIWCDHKGVISTN